MRRIASAVGFAAVGAGAAVVGQVIWAIVAELWAAHPGRGAIVVASAAVLGAVGWIVSERDE